jgi:MFS family permease
MHPDEESMTPVERRASIGLAGIYGLRMLGMFIILPIFAIFAQQLPGGEDHTLIGLALGAYGLTQAILQIPAGWMSDRYGRKPVIYAGLALFAIGSFVAASADNIYMIIFGRVIQGAGAINAAVMALTADLTREEHRTKAMAMIGMTIGITFSISLVLSPVLYHLIGVPGIFVMTGVLSIAAFGVVAWVIPNPKITRFHSETEASTKKFGEVLRNKDLLRLDFGIFVQHAILMSVFMQVPFVLKRDGLEATQHWMVYLPVMLAAFALMVPPIIYAEKKARMKQVFIGAVALAAVSQVALLLFRDSIWGVALSLLLFFAAFNVLEATLPSMISKIAPLAAKGTAMGVYSSVQFLGAFFGAAAGGYILQNYGGDAVFVFAIALLVLWLLASLGMKSPAAVRTRLYHLPEITEAQGMLLQQKLAQLPGVREAMVAAAEGMACLKIEMQGFDESAVEKLIEGA